MDRPVSAADAEAAGGLTAIVRHARRESGSGGSRYSSDDDGFDDDHGDFSTAAVRPARLNTAAGRFGAKQSACLFDMDVATPSPDAAMAAPVLAGLRMSMSRPPPPKKRRVKKGRAKDAKPKKKKRPGKMANNIAANGTLRVCCRCGTTETPKWRKSVDNRTYCNACGLHAKKQLTKQLEANGMAVRRPSTASSARGAAPKGIRLAKTARASPQ